jgi:dephospho-CoA kinase
MVRIGLTGGIGSGKSTVARLFAARGVPVIDADNIAHELTRPGGPAEREIIAAFGNEIAPGGHIDRKALAARVFSSTAERRRLEAILHPRIRHAMEQAMLRLDTQYCLCVIPLLIEADQHDLVDRILVVDADENARIERIRARDGRNEREIRAILASQVSRAQRLAAADDVIVNNGDLSALEDQVNSLHRHYLGLSADE